MTDSDLEMAMEMMQTRLGRADFSGNRPCKCPLAPWTHSKGADKQPSMSVKNTSSVPIFNCHSCHTQGAIWSLAETYSQNSGDNRALEFLRTLSRQSGWGQKMEFKSHRYQKIGKKAQKILEFDVTEEKLNQYSMAFPEYGLKRGILGWQVKKWDLRFDQREARLLFPVRDHFGRIKGWTGRDCTGQSKLKYKHYPGLKKELVLYGSQYLEESVTRSHVVEGPMDVLRLDRMGIKNVFSPLGSSLSQVQMDFLNVYSKEVIFVPDADDGGPGLQFAQVYGERLLMMRDGIKVGVAGVQHNPKYVQRDRPKLWEEVDYRFVPIDLLKGKDPSDLNDKELHEVLNTVCWIELRACSESMDEEDLVEISVSN